MGSGGGGGATTTTVAPGQTFEVPIDVKAPSILKFSFHAEGGSVEFSVVHTSGVKKLKETQLLPPSTYTENIGEVLLPGQGVCVVRFFNPTGWFYSSQVKLRYSLTAAATQPIATKSTGKAKAAPKSAMLSMNEARPP